MPNAISIRSKLSVRLHKLVRLPPNVFSINCGAFLIKNNTNGTPVADAEAQKKREMAEAARAAAMAQEAANSKDEDMADAETTKPDEIVEPAEKK